MAVALAIVVVALFMSRIESTGFARDIVTEVELEDAVKFFVVAFVVLPVPAGSAPGAVRRAQSAKVWLLVVLLTGIGWVGYIGVRALGPRGLLVTGLAGRIRVGECDHRLDGPIEPIRGRRPGATGQRAGGSLTHLPATADRDRLRRRRCAAGCRLPVVIAAAVLVAVAAAVYRERRTGRAHISAGQVATVPAGRPFALRPRSSLPPS